MKSITPQPPVLCQIGFHRFIKYIDVPADTFHATYNKVYSHTFICTRCHKLKDKIVQHSPLPK